MPSRLPPHKPDQSRAPSLRRVVLHAFVGTTSPSDSLPAPRDFSRPALYARPLPDTGCQVGSLLFRILLSQRAAASEPRRGPADPLVFVCCLLPSPRHDRLGPLKHLSADTMTWLQRSLSLRPAGLLSACSGLLTPRSARSDLSFRLGSATGCSSACPDRSFTCKKYASSSGRAIGRLWRGTDPYRNRPVSIKPLSNRACGFPAHGLTMIFCGVACAG
jgi:hypothetical protein